MSLPLVTRSAVTDTLFSFLLRFRAVASLRGSHDPLTDSVFCRLSIDKRVRTLVCWDMLYVPFRSLCLNVPEDYEIGCAL